MFREFVILLCAGTYVSGIAVHSGTQKAPAKFEAAQQQDHLALPSQNSYQNVAAAQFHNSVPSYQVSPAVVDTISQAKQAASVPAQSYGSPNVQQPVVRISASVAADPSSSEYKNILNRYAPAVEPINPYFAVPVAAKTVLVGSQAAGHSAQADNNGYISRPFVVYTNNAAQSGQQYYAVPSAQTLVESQKSVNVPPPSNQGNQYGAPAVGYSTISGPSTPRPFYPPSNAILESHATYKVNQVNQANQVQASPLPTQYIPAPKITYVKPAVPLQTVSVPVGQKVSIEAYNSVQSHPLPAPKYAPAPIPVPVIYQQVETNPAPAQQFILTKTLVPTAAPYAQVPVGFQPVSVPVYANNGARMQYLPISVTGGQQNGYAKAVLFSPASEVSHVVFNGLGVSYGW